MLLDGFVFLQQSGIHLIHDLLGFRPLVLEIFLLAFGLLFIISLELIEGFFRIGGIQTNTALQFFVGIRFLHDTADLHFILTDRIAAAADFCKQGFDFVRRGGRSSFKALLQVVQLFLGTDNGLVM